VRRLIIAIALATAIAWPVSAQMFDGYASLLVDAFPNVQHDRHDGVVELRSRLFAEYQRGLGKRIHFTIGGFAEGLVADRAFDNVVRAGIVRPQEVSVEARWSHADLRTGFSRVVWGRLDEFQPTDVVNPQDLTRFFLEGRAEGRMPVAMVRGRWLPSDQFALEAIYVPVFRRGRFDQLDEPTSPFNVVPLAPFITREPRRSFGNAQGGLRASGTTGRVDWSVSAYRGFESLPLYEGLAGRFPRFTMIGGDFETVRGPWGIRGEVAAFVDRTLAVQTQQALVQGHTLDAGVGVDRKSGAYRVSGTVMFNTQPDRHDVTLVSSIDRTFARETRTIRAFGVYNPGEGSAFLRVIGTISLRDNVSVEGSGGLFVGDGGDVLSRFRERDFLYARLKVFF
jgi:Protein of unknown function (DUF1302)